MKILHVIIKSKNTEYNVTRPYIKFINENFDFRKHEFAIVNDKVIPDFLKKYDNIYAFDIKIKKDLKKMLNLLKNSDKIIFHSLYMFDFKSMLLMLFKP